LRSELWCSEDIFIALEKLTYAQFMCIRKHTHFATINIDAKKNFAGKKKQETSQQHQQQQQLFRQMGPNQSQFIVKTINKYAFPFRVCVCVCVASPCHALLDKCGKQSSR